MGRRSRSSQNEEASQDATINSEESASPTFKEAKGTEANQHAKALAKKEAEKKAKQETFKHFYTLIGNKVLKMICKANGVYSVYIGNMKKHGDAMKSQIAKWEKEGLFFQGHEAKKKSSELRAEAIQIKKK